MGGWGVQVMIDRTGDLEVLEGQEVQVTSDKTGEWASKIREGGCILIERRGTDNDM